ncbi:Coagulation factor X [Smittium mucronatum]|uniref:Coagulation factor X n=1 Tax=Smittium mucronatum TaxID=133383 RepID=A0A1R0H2F8_9FUNG|nr:Coagulation factor X [Smittium mucronatum]
MDLRFIFNKSLPVQYKPKEHLIKRVTGEDAINFYSDVVVKITIGYQNSKLYCTGTFLNSRFILTAASCFLKDGKEADYNKVIVSVGDSFNEMRFRLEKIIKHEGFNANTFENNIAILKLSGNISLKGNLFKVEPQELEKRDSLKIVGYGFTNIKDNINSKRFLRSLEITQNNGKLCDKYEKTGKSYCYEVSFNQSTCYGDMGGPVLIQRENVFYIFGISSHFYSSGKRGSCGENGDIGFMTLVSEYKSWIDINSVIDNI